MSSKLFKSLLVLFILLIPTIAKGQVTPDQYLTFMEDGSWCWFSDPRAVYHEDNFKRSYIGSVSSEGDIQIGYYDHESGETFEKTIYPDFQSDDHVNPSLL
ncbi:hypothetical protein, partial [Marinilabilia sp.]